MFYTKRGKGRSFYITVSRTPKEHNSPVPFTCSNSNEVGLLYTSGQYILPVEIRSNQTITKSYFRGLKKFRALFQEQTPWSSLLIYAGKMEQHRKDVKIIRIDSLVRCLEETDHNAMSGMRK